MTEPTSPEELTRALESALPQTQCTRCGYENCAAYAQAISSGAAGINQCPPGGSEGIERLAALSGKPVIPLSSVHGFEGPRSLAVIDEAWCIGCTLCLAACPTDAIIGSNKRMHGVIEPYCTGCELCIPVCPVDCIRLENVTGERTGWAAWSSSDAAIARERYDFHRFRKARDATAQAEKLQQKAEIKLADLASHSQHTDPTILEKKRLIIQAALARARAKKAGGSGT